jgi:hypothetical protein
MTADEVRALPHYELQKFANDFMGPDVDWDLIRAAEEELLRRSAALCADLVQWEEFERETRRALAGPI